MDLRGYGGAYLNNHMESRYTQKEVVRHAHASRVRISVPAHGWIFVVADLLSHNKAFVLHFLLLLSLLTLLMVRTRLLSRPWVEGERGSAWVSG